MKQTEPAVPLPTKRVKAGTSVSAAADRRLAFVNAYIANGRNGTQAAITAGYSPRTAGEQAARLLADVRTRSLIKSIAAPVLAEQGLDAAEVLRLIGRVGRFDVRKTFDDQGNPKPPHLWDDETATAISHFSANGAVPFDRLKALDMAAKNLGLFEKDNAHVNKPVMIKMVFE